MFAETKIRKTALDRLGGWHCQQSVCIRLLVVSNLFGTRDQFCGRQFFHRLGGGERHDLGMIQMHYIYRALYFYYCYVLVQFSHSVMSNCLWLQHARPPCPSPTPRACSNSCPLSRWCHRAISSSVIPFSRLHSFPASGSFPMNQFFTLDGQSTGVSASVSVFPGLISFSIDWLDLLAVQGTLKSLLQHHISKASIVVSAPLQITRH